MNKLRMTGIFLVLFSGYGVWGDPIKDLNRKVLNGDVNGIRLALKEGANLNTLDENGMSPLHHASKTNQIEIARLLLKYEADPNLKGENGNTALHYAVESGHKQMTELIVGKGGSLEIENNFGVSPLELAKQSNNQSVLSAFKSKDSGAIQNKMTLTVYGFYLCITILVTIWVAKTLSKNGRIFLIDAFLGDENLADSVNRLLVVGFYLINIGYVAVSLKLGLKPLNSTDAIEILSSKIGWVILILGAMHFFNLFALSRLRRNGIAKKELQSTAGRIR